MIGKVRNIESSIFSEVFDWELISIEESAKVTAEQLKSYESNIEIFFLSNLRKYYAKKYI